MVQHLDFHPLPRNDKIMIFVKGSADTHGFWTHLTQMNFWISDFNLNGMIVSIRPKQITVKIQGTLASNIH